MKINFKELDYAFKTKPLIVGGVAMEYYRLRKAGNDIDLIITSDDYDSLVAKYPNNKVNIFGDLGIKVFEFEIWKWIVLFDYNYLSKNAIEEENVLVVSLENLLLMKAIAADADKKYADDLKLVSDKIKNIQYGKDKQFDKGFFKK